MGRNVAVLQYTRFAYTDQATRRQISNATTPKHRAFDTKWAELNLAPMRMRGRAELPEASLILTSVKPELTVGGKLRTRTFLAPFGYEEIKIVYGEEEDQSAGKLKIQTEYRTLTGATLEMKILSQCGESTMKDFKPSPMNHGKGSVVGQLVPVEYNRLILSVTVSIEEPAGGYREMLEYRNSVREYLMALEDKSAMEGYLETMM